uniref:Type I restriction enzyme R protein N terminus (HSDR_N) n=1 Tax=Candidatus Kentrum eta TaxID=2126337 RepID=A0A450UBH9_9GAMM|nr:MAG: hypothetical protein BECKH772A_GA0070896_1001516 [Candidatus Kentron sp. H]VFJ91014.1 MAG: hypothetical protein BECKH772B_GA0070898_1001316 [Candidatus Kentron sp. H]VFJ97328.1 MAG: hypothetical protein BECKH772C_GA0070978_1001216 [Candidatus Kentron sp. H]
MPFSDYKTLAQVQTDYRIKYREQGFIAPRPWEPSSGFLSEFAFNRENMDMFSSEAARCQMVIFPIVREVYKHYCRTTSLWVRKPIAFDDKLNGTPDYIVSRRSELGKTVLEHPLLIVAEAKRNDFEQGWAQCLSELIAARNLNLSERAVYGIVTDGKLWEFGRLEGDVFTKNTDSPTLTPLPGLFGALHAVFHMASHDPASRDDGA